jgi:hypothetical protein
VGLGLLGLAACEAGAAATRDAGATDATLASDGALPGDAAPSRDGGGTSCVDFSDGVEVGRVDVAALGELSGLAASRVRDDLLYAHNDSGDAPRVFLLDGQGRGLGTLALEGADAIDWEDVAVGPGPGGASFLYVGDTGDNAARTGTGTPRASVTVYRVAEPAFERGAPVALSLPAEAIELTYPDRPHDCESIAVDPASGDLYLLAKEDAPSPTLFVARAPLASGVLEPVLALPLREAATGMDFSPRGRGLLVRSYSAVRLWTRLTDEPWSAALARTAERLPMIAEPQGESVAWRRDGLAYFTASEGARPPLHRFDALPGCEPL